MVVKFSDSVKANIEQKFISLKKQNQKLNITFDKWTSQNNQRCLNLNVHMGAKDFNLGLIGIHRSCNAEYCVELVAGRLNSFDIDLQKDIIAVTTDGASVMAKVG